MLTPRQYAERVGVAYTTVATWLQRGQLPEAVKIEGPGGHMWSIPETAKRPDLGRGRPPKAEGKQKRRAA